MPRRRRYFLPNIPIHVIQRGNNRHVCFFRDRDYSLYLSKLHDYSIKYGIAIHSFVLMTNHVHLLLTAETDTGVSQLMQALGSFYVQSINASYHRTGTLWEGRFKASLVNSKRHLLTVSRYIELNPVRARMVAHPSIYRWSSYQSNGLGKCMKLLTPHSVYLALGKNTEERCANYRSLFSGRVADLSDEQIRTATNKGWVLGDNKFKAQIEAQLGHSIPPLNRGGDRRSGITK